MAQRLGDTLPYRGVEFGLFDKGRGQWRWTYYPKMGLGLAKSGTIDGTRKMAIAAVLVSLATSIQSSKHSGNSVLCLRSVPSTKRFIDPSQRKNHRLRIT
jgi:hypothetical protein